MTVPDLKLQTPAKINWTLEVLGRRADGFHEVALVFQTIGLWDELVFWKKEKGFELDILEAPGPLEADDSNLVLKAARFFLEAAEIPGGLRVELKKRIPLAAGLGGGSSDAAATLWGLNRIYGTDFSTAQLRELAAPLGSDVPFFLTGGVALGSGRGEKIKSWESSSTYWLVLAKPLEGLSTPRVYQSGQAAFTSGDRARNFREVLAQGDPRALADRLYNGLEPAAFHLLPRVESIKNGLLDAGALGALVSGSGPTVFGLAPDEETAHRLAEKMKPQAEFVLAVPTVSGGPRIIS